MKIIPSWRRSNYLARFGIFLILAALITGMPASYGVGGDDNHPSQNLEIYTWYDLNAVRDNLEGHHILMNNLNSTTPGYEELASQTANGGKGWQPIGNSTLGVSSCGGGTPWINYYFGGTLDGQGHEIRDLFINRPDENWVGLFGGTEGDVIKDIGVVNVTVTGADYVGGLVGSNCNTGSVINSYFSGNVTGESRVGGLAGSNRGTVFNSYSTGNVTGSSSVGGLVGYSDHGTVSNSYSTGNVTGSSSVGGLVGVNRGSVNSSHSMCSVIGVDYVGGLVGYTYKGTVSDSYATGNVTGHSDVGGLVGLNGHGVPQTNGAGNVSDSYSTGNVNGAQCVGGLVGHNYEGSVSNSYATGNVTGYSYVGGLVGLNGHGVPQTNGAGTVRDSYSTGNVNGNQYVGGLVGKKAPFISAVSNSFWDTETSGQATSDGGTGKNTTEMKNITTFSGVGWNIIVVALNETSPAYIWNIVNNVTYPFLSWQS